MDIDGCTWFTHLGKWLGNSGQTLVMVGVTIAVSAAVIASMGTLAPLAAPLLVGVIAGTAGGAVGGLLGAAFNGGNLLQGAVTGGISGAISGLAGGAVGQWAVKSNLLKGIGINGINSPVLKSALAGGLVRSGGIGGFAYKVSKEDLPVYVNTQTGWVCIGNPKEKGNAVEFINNCVAVINDNGEFLALWLKPQTLPEIYRSDNTKASVLRGFRI